MPNYIVTLTDWKPITVQTFDNARDAMDAFDTLHLSYIENEGPYISYNSKTHAIEIDAPADDWNRVRLTIPCEIVEVLENKTLTEVK